MPNFKVLVRLIQQWADRVRFRNVPTQLRLVLVNMYIISGPESIQEVFREPRLHNKAYKALSVHNMFKMPKDTLAFWMDDSSGHHSQPYPESNIPPHLRIDYLVHSSVTRFLTGDGLKPFARRFVLNVAERLSMKRAINQDWTDIPDLFEFLQAELTPAAVEAMWGRQFFKINPDFVADLWKFSKELPVLAKGYPRWLAPRQYKTRDACFASIRRWHQAVWTHLNDPITSRGDWNEDYGADIVKFRLEAWAKMPRMGADGMATEDLGMIWAYVQYLHPLQVANIIYIIQRECKFHTCCILDDCRGDQRRGITVSSPIRDRKLPHRLGD